MVSAHPTLTISRLRAMAKLYREGVAGVAEQLANLATRAPEVLNQVLGVDYAWSNTPPEPAKRAAFVLHAVESAQGRARDARKSKARARAEQLAAELAAKSTLSDDGLELDAPTLGALVRVSGYRELGLIHQGELRVIERRRLNAILRECKRARIRHLRVADEALHIGYQTAYGHGSLRLFLQPATLPDEHVLVVPAPVAHTAQIHQLPQQEGLPQGATLEPHTPPDPRPVVTRVLRAFTEAMSTGLAS